MKINKGPKRRSLIIGFIIVAALVGGGIAGWNFFKYRLIKHKVSSMLYKNSHGLYTVEYDSLSVDEVGGNLSVTNLRLIPDTARFRELYTTRQTAPSLLIAVNIPLLRVTGVKTPRAVLDKELEGSKVEINNAELMLYHTPKRTDDTTGKAPGPSLQETLLQLLNSLRLIKADTLQVENASLSFVDFIGNEQRVKGAAISIHLYHILIDSTSVMDTSRFFFARQADVSIEKVVVNDKKGFYHYTVDQAQFHSASRSFILKNVRVAPLLGEEEMMRASGTQVDRFDMHCGAIALKNLDLPRLMKGAIIADTLSIGGANIKVFRDLNFPRNGRSMVGKFPHQLLMKLGIPYNLEKVQVSDAFIEYKEKNNKSDSSGKVQFYHSAIAISHLTNIAADLAKNNNCVLDFDTRFLNMASLHSTIVLKLKDPDGRFTVKGSVGNFDATRLNVLLRPMALAQIEKGRINKLSFDLNCDNTTSRGKLVLLYDDLKISVLKKDGDEKLKEKKLASFIANIVVKNANPLKKDKTPREATINYTRLIDRSFFNVIWKAILTGIKETVGVQKG